MQVINHIHIEEGKAYIAGRKHLKAEMVARMVVDGAYSVEDTMAQYNLSAAEVHAALSYYYDNREELDAVNEQKWQTVQKNASNAGNHLAELRKNKE